MVFKKLRPTTQKDSYDSQDIFELWVRKILSHNNFPVSEYVPPPTDRPQIMTFMLQIAQKTLIFASVLSKFDIPLGESL